MGWLGKGKPKEPVTKTSVKKPKHKHQYVDGRVQRNDKYRGMIRVEQCCTGCPHTFWEDRVDC